MMGVAYKKSFIIGLPLFIISMYYALLIVSSHHLRKKDNEVFEVTQMEQDDVQIQKLAELGLSTRRPLKLTSDSSEYPLHGRFLHITDLHPDEFYKPGSNIDEACHHGKNGRKSNMASEYGDAIKGCDSPLKLVEETLKWCSENLRDKIDFVVWTGDNIRHDNDRRYPRLETDIFDMNERMSDLMHKSFLEDDGTERVKVIPSLGNNDVYPHNLFSPGPTLQTRELYQIWKNFVPSEQLHVFARGAYFFREIVPGKLAVLSINTLYLFRSNPLVDNCDNRKQPGHKLFEWLGVVLKELRSRQMKVWITGHVPPTPKNYDPTCLRKQIVWLYEYRDIIVGSLFGHMNIDHFIPLDSQKAYRSINKNLKVLGLEDDFYKIEEDGDGESESDVEGDDEDDFMDLEELNAYLDIHADDETFGSEPHIMGGAQYGKVDYMDLIRDTFYSRVKGKRKRGVHAERYAILHITLSVVPSFNPGLRVWEYNITGLEDDFMVSDNRVEQKPWTEFLQELEKEIFVDDDEEVSNVDDIFLRNGPMDYGDFDDYDASENLTSASVMTQEQMYQILRKDKTFPPVMPPGTPLGPAYVPQVFSPERYVQYYVDLASLDSKKEFKYEIEYSTDDEHYQMPSLLVENWISLAKDLGQPLREKRAKKSLAEISGVKRLQKLWQTYLTRSFVSTGYENMKDYN